MKWIVQVSKISLVDLAGSERADSSGAKGTRLKVRILYVATKCILCLTLYLILDNCFTGRSKYQQISDHTGKSDIGFG